MIKLTSLPRFVVKNTKNISGLPYLICRGLSNKQDSSSSSDNEISDKNLKSKEAIRKLNLLLLQMVNEDPVITQPKLDLARPKRKKNIETKPKTENGETQVENNIVESVKNVAKSLGGNVNQTESELLSKLLNLSDKSSGEKQSEPVDLSELVKGMKIDTEIKVSSEMSRARYVRSLLSNAQDLKAQAVQGKDRSRKGSRKGGVEETVQVRDKIDLFVGDGLNYFKPDDECIVAVENKTWDKLKDRELKLAVTHPPANYFQQMILWTEEGKLWKFPIDNEQGMEEEQNVCFTEHIFLEKHLEPWCPPKGPIRHYMELVCVGLSKNPYLSVKEKCDHIMWYKDYFAEKQKLLKEVGAIPLEFEINQKQISKE